METHFSLEDSPTFRMIRLDEVDSTNSYLRRLDMQDDQRLTLVTAEFQSGGTFNLMTTPGAQSNGDLVQIEYGYIIKTTPLIIDDNTVNLDFTLDNKQPLSRDSADIEISRYQTKSKYLVRPGESIAISTAITPIGSARNTSIIAAIQTSKARFTASCPCFFANRS